MSPVLWKHGVHCNWIFLTSYCLYILRTPDSSHRWSALGILLNLSLCTFLNIWVHIVGEYYLHVEYICVVSRGVSAPPTVQEAIEPFCWIFYGLFLQTHAYDRSIPPDIICVCWNENWCLFLVHTGSCICETLHLSIWDHDCHWHLLPRDFVIRHGCWYIILLHWLY